MITLNNEVKEEIYLLKKQKYTYEKIINILLEKWGIKISETTLQKRCIEIFAEKEETNKNALVQMFIYVDKFVKPQYN